MNNEPSFVLKKRNLEKAFNRLERLIAA